MRKLRANLLLLLAAFIWGSAFVAQSLGAELVQPFSFLAARSYLGVLTLTPVVLVRRSQRKRAEKPEPNFRATLIGGICCGLVLCAASASQQFGMSLDATASKAGFLTTMYVPLVPVLSLILFRRRVRGSVWIAIAMAVVGLVLLNGGSLSFSAGEALLLFCALMFAVHILVVDHFSAQTDPVSLSWMQFAVCAVTATLLALLTEQTSWESLRAAAGTIAYAGVLSSGVAYTLQIVGQKDTDPTVATLLMSLESVFSCLCGWLVQNDRLSPLEWLGCVLMFGAVLLVELPGSKKNSTD